MLLSFSLVEIFSIPLLAASEAALVNTEKQLWEQTDITLAKLAQALLIIEKKLEGLQKDALADTADGHQRSILNERIKLTGKWRIIVERMGALQGELTKVASESARLIKTLELEEKKPAPKPPTKPTPEGHAELIKEE